MRPRLQELQGKDFQAKEMKAGKLGTNDGRTPTTSRRSVARKATPESKGLAPKFGNLIVYLHTLRRQNGRVEPLVSFRVTPVNPLCHFYNFESA